MKLNLKDSVLDEKGKEEFLEKVKQLTDVFSLRDEIGTCPFIKVHLKLKDETPFFVRPYPMRKEQKKVIQKEMNRLEHLGIIHKGLTGYSSLIVLVKWKNQNLYQVCSDFRILNEKLVKINHACTMLFPGSMQGCFLPVFLSLILSCTKWALVWGNCCERLGVEIFVRVLHSSRVNFNYVNNTKVFCVSESKVLLF